MPEGPPDGVRDRLPETAAVAKDTKFRRRLELPDGSTAARTFVVTEVRRNGGTIIHATTEVP